MSIYLLNMVDSHVTMWYDIEGDTDVTKQNERGDEHGPQRAESQDKRD